MLARSAHDTLLNLAVSFPIVAVTGPRQSGKTTLTRAVFQDKPYVSLEELDHRDFAKNDPRGFLAQFPQGAILDEIQRCPDLFSYLQTIVDEQATCGLFVLTGSQQFGLRSGISQSLAGRVGMVSLLPFSLQELQQGQKAPTQLDDLLFQGLYPPVYDRQPNPVHWYDSYVQTYIERDVRTLINVQDLSTFQRFMQLCASHTGQLLNMANMANAVGISQATVKAWLSVLEASYLIYLLRPQHVNFNKRLVKMPKLYLLDTGIAARLLGIQSAQQLAVHPLRGAFFETWVVGELLKARYAQGLSSNLSFWRSHTGDEVDVLLDDGMQLSPIEIKSGQTLGNDAFKRLLHWQRLAGSAAGPARLVYGGTQGYTRQNVQVVPWQDLK